MTIFLFLLIVESDKDEEEEEKEEQLPVVNDPPVEIKEASQGLFDLSRKFKIISFNFSTNR